MSDSVERVSWDEFYRTFRWRQGEHLTIIGPTWAGKSNLASWLLPLRDYVVFLGTKTTDELYDHLQDDGYRRLSKWDDLRYDDRRVLLWPSLRRIGRDVPKQRRILREALHEAFVQRGWTFVVDEGRWVADNLGLGSELVVYWQQGRSAKLTLVFLAQRPRWVPLEALSQARHLFLFFNGDEQDLRRLAEIGGKADTSTIRAAMPTLGEYEFLYVNVASGRMLVSRAPLKGGK